jgi:2-amino-4-hydroxy-6-hydroxymethyldihydropteridine diphosphokinase
VKATVAFIGLGSNLGHPRRQLARATAAIARLRGCRILHRSRDYVSAPVACALPQPDFVNAVVALSTTRHPHALLAALLAIERMQRRRRDPSGIRNTPRTLDLDLLLYGRRRVRSARLTVPHPRMHRRAFVLRPLADIAPGVVIPGRGLARRFLRGLADQRIATTRDHALHG